MKALTVHVSSIKTFIFLLTSMSFHKTLVINKKWVPLYIKWP